MALSKEELRQGEKLISDFMEYETCTDPDHADDKCYQVPYAKGYHRLHQMQHHSSWDWLMPVVQKIGDISIDYYQENNLPAYEECGKVLSTHIVVSIETVWNKVVQFIKWFNSQKQ